MKILGGKWPRKGIKKKRINSAIRTCLTSIADCRGLIMGYPQGCPTVVSVKVFEKFLPFQANAITGKKISHISRGINEAEQEVVLSVVNLLGGKKSDFSGIITNGATIANLYGIQMGRDCLLNRTGWRPGKKISVFCSSFSHYSIFQVCQTLSLERNLWQKRTSQVSKDERIVEYVFIEDASGSGIQLVGTDKLGRILINSLEKRIENCFKKGVRDFIVIANAGITLTGAVDDIVGISLLLKRLKDEFAAKDKKNPVGFHFHIDAAYGGLILPFMDNSPLRYLIDLNRNYNLRGRGHEVDSLGIDPHKRCTPYPCGVYIFKQGLEKFMEMDVPYLGGKKLFGGSRQGASVMAFWANIAFYGYDGYQKKIKKCFDNTEYLIKLLKEIPGIEIISSELCVICFSFNGRRLSKDLENKYYIYQTSFPIDPENIFSHSKNFYKIIVMDHWQKKEMRNFYYDVKNFLKKI